MKVNERSAIQTISEGIGANKLSEIKRKHGGKLKFPVYYRADFIDSDLGELELSVRAYNGLRRAGFFTVRDLVDGIESQDDLSRIRNLGAKSVQEVMNKLFIYHYMTMKTEKQHAYLERLVELNK